MLKIPKVYWTLILGGLLIIVISFFLWNMGAPWLANHFGFALPGDGGLPYRISYGGRDYANLNTCARAGWCPNTANDSLCRDKEKVQQLNPWPLIQVGSVTTMIGSPYSLMASQADISSKRTIMLVYVEYKTDCYILYTIEGGP